MNPFLFYLLGTLLLGVFSWKILRSTNFVKNNKQTSKLNFWLELVEQKIILLKRNGILVEKIVVSPDVYFLIAEKEATLASKGDKCKEAKTAALLKFLERDEDCFLSINGKQIKVEINFQSQQESVEII